MSKKQSQSGKDTSKYSYQFKVQVGKAFHSGRMKPKEIVEKFGLPSVNVAYHFRAWFYEQGLDKEELPELSLQDLTQVDALQRQIEELKAKLDHEQLKSAGLNTMIDIAEKELGIEIRKKSDSKQ